MPIRYSLEMLKVRAGRDPKGRGRGWRAATWGMSPGQVLAACAHMTKVSGTALVVALVIVLGIAMPLHAQICPPSSIEYTPRTSSGAFFSAGDLEALRA